MRDDYRDTITALKTDADRTREVFHLAIAVIIALGAIIVWMAWNFPGACP